MYISEIWGGQSDPYQHALFLIRTSGSVLCSLLSKFFLAEISFPNESSQNCSVDGVNTTCDSLNTTSRSDDKNSEFQSDIFLLYRIVGIAVALAALLDALELCSSGCHFKSISLQKRLKRSKGKESGLRKVRLWESAVVIILISITGLLLSAVGETLASFLLIFTFEFLHWAKPNASDLATVFWVGSTFSRFLSVILSRLLSANKILGVYIVVTLTTMFAIIFTLEATTISFWIGVFVIGSCVGSASTAALCAGKKETPHIGVLSSLVMSSIAAGRIVGPVVGYLLDNADHMWFFYICIVYSSGASLTFGTFLLAQCAFGRKTDDAETMQEIPEERKLSEDPGLSESAAKTIQLEITR